LRDGAKYPQIICKKAASKGRVNELTATDKERDDAHRAVGRYVVEFSRLIFHMRFAVERCLAGEKDIVIARLALGEAAANQVNDSFFAICSYMADLDDDEVRVSRHLKKQVREEIKRRNDFAHGDWWIGFGAKEDGAMANPTLWRTKPGRQRQDVFSREIPVPEIDSYSNGLYVLRQQVAEFGDLCLETWPLAHKYNEPVRVRHVFRVDQAKEIVRDGSATQGGAITYS
jgi:hypothetical protein